MNYSTENGIINKEIIISKVKIMVITWSKVHADDSRHILNESKGLKVEVENF